MNFWNSLPLFRLIFPFILGILFFDVFSSTGLILISTCLFACAFLIHFFVKSYAGLWWYGVVVAILLFCLGGYATHYSITSNDKHYFEKYLEENSVLLLELSHEPILGLNSKRCVAKVLSVDGKQTTGKVLLYFEKESDSLEYGRQLITILKPQLVDENKNPYQFNYSTYLSLEHIYHQMYLKSDNYILVDEIGGSSFFHFVNKCRWSLSNILIQNGLNDNQLSVCSALLLGDKSLMDYELRHTFVKAGVMHVLAVSGLHVGILYLLLIRLLNVMNKAFALKLFKLVIIISILWLYAFITSLSPSVMRAATMFSFFAIGHFLGRTTNIYNTLAASAFLLLIIHPLMIYKIGFQLSYLAVLGIVSIYPKLYNLVLFKSKWLDSVWQLVCVSIAAQTATFSLAVYYFHQFPNYFLLANILVLPLVPIIINLGLALFILDAVDFISEPLVILLKWTIDVLFDVIDFIQNLPYSTINFLHFHWYEVVLIYGIICFFLLFIYNRKKVFSVIVLSLIVVLQFVHWQDIKWHKKNPQIVFYSVYNHTAFGYLAANKGTFFMDEKLLHDQKKQSINLHNHWAFMGLKEKHLMKLDSNIRSSICWKKDYHLQLADKRIVLVNESFKLKETKKPILVDYCLISNYVSIPELLKIYEPKLIILDGGFPYYATQQIEQELEEEGVRFHNLKQDGALIVGLIN